VDSLSTDVTLLTIGGDVKTACKVKDKTIRLPDGTEREHGPLSWALGQALLNTAPDSNWITIMAEMEHLMQGQGWIPQLSFRGQPTQTFGR
jgi:hypothetical protein